MIDHITYQVLPEIIDLPNRWRRFFKLIGFEEVEPEEYVPAGWKVRWFRSEAAETEVAIHIVSAPAEAGYHVGLAPTLSHFAVWIGHYEFEQAKHSEFLTRARPGSKRIWLECLGVKVEVRST